MEVVPCGTDKNREQGTGSGHFGFLHSGSALGFPSTYESSDEVAKEKTFVGLFLLIFLPNVRKDKE